MSHRRLEPFVIAGFVRGLSVRYVEDTLAEALGPEAALSKSTVSRVCEPSRTKFDVWKRRKLSDVNLEYLFLDGSHFRYHNGARASRCSPRMDAAVIGRPSVHGIQHWAPSCWV